MNENLFRIWEVSFSFSLLVIMEDFNGLIGVDSGPPVAGNEVLARKTTGVE